MQQLVQLYTETYGHAPVQIETLAKAGSNRQYIRLTADDGTTVIGVIGTDVAENRAFIYLAQHFASKGLPVPAIYALSEDGRCYLQQDLGCRALYAAVAHGRQNDGQYDENEVALLRRTIRLLPHVQIEGAEGLDFDQLLAPTVFDRRAALFDLHYFKYCFFKTTDVPVNEVLLEDDLDVWPTIL